MQIDELTRAYAAKSDEELLLLARKPEDLTPEAQSLLRDELVKRRIAAETVIAVDEAQAIRTFATVDIDELARSYQLKSDEELLLLWRKPQELTLDAESLLRDELARRRIATETVIVAEESELAAVLSKVPVPKPVVDGAKSSAEFLKEVTQLYRDNFWVFIKLIAPAVVISYLIAIELRSWSRALAFEVFSHRSSTTYNTMMFEVTTVALFAKIISGLLFCVCFAAICAAVARISKREKANSVVDCFLQVRDRKSALFLVSMVCLVVIQVAMVISRLPMFGLITLQERFGFRVSYYSILTIGYVLFFGAMLLISRLALAMPAVVLDDYRIGQAFFRSDELTRGKWMELASLLTKSVIGGYVAGMLPFWAATLLWRWVQLPILGLDAASVVGVTMVEPFMFIGFALMYVQGRANEVAE